tara:strand:- start:86 stop:457 length:372 start_codon:yes stop_codon:yes gene_type:complete
MKKVILSVFLLIHLPLHSEIFNSKQEEKILTEKLLASYTYAYMNCRIKQTNIKKEIRDKGITTTYQVAGEILKNKYKLDPNLLKNEKVMKTAKEMERHIGSNCNNKIFLQSEEIFIDLINSLR